jgi:hypothetical protein
MTSARQVFCLLVLASCSRHEPPPQGGTHNRYGRLPLSFEVNNSTQFILINGVSAQTSNGMLRFFSQAGQPVI